MAKEDLVFIKSPNALKTQGTKNKAKPKPKTTDKKKK